MRPYDLCIRILRISSSWDNASQGNPNGLLQIQTINQFLTKWSQPTLIPYILMTIANLFKRYERWNPVHPTYGAFWGLGIGVGCGVGWGPGFGPEVIGYVGAGCGVGFSVGVTLVGFGIGLPASGLTCVPYNAVSATGYGMLDFAKYNAIPTIARFAGTGREYVAPHISNFERRAYIGLSKLIIEYSLLWNRHAIKAENTIKDQLSSIRHHACDHAAKATGFLSFGMPWISSLPQIMHRTNSSESKDD